MDTTLLFTIIGTGIGSVGIITAVNVSLIGWLRGDMKSFENEMRGWMTDFKNEISKEMKDFHGRLCTIEERNRAGANQTKSKG